MARTVGNVARRTRRWKVYQACMYLMWADFNGRLSDYDLKHIPVALGMVLAYVMDDLAKWYPELEQEVTGE